MLVKLDHFPRWGLKIKDAGKHHLENMIVRIKHIPILIGTLPKNGSPVLEINNIREIPQNYHTFAPRSLIPSKIARIHLLKSTWHTPDVLVYMGPFTNLSFWCCAMYFDDKIVIFRQNFSITPHVPMPVATASMQPGASSGEVSWTLVRNS